MTLAVLEAWGEIGFQCVDTTAYLVQEGVMLYEKTGELFWLRDDAHINGHGHEALAKIMAKKIVKAVITP